MPRSFCRFHAVSMSCNQTLIRSECAGAGLSDMALIKERMAALVTDGLRAQYLEREGYDTQVLEFIDMEHTPKNILLRAVKTGKKGQNAEAIRRCEEALGVSSTLGRLLDERKYR